jgi:hypothetical protein
VCPLFVAYFAQFSLSLQPYLPQLLSMFDLVVLICHRHALLRIGQIKSSNNVRYYN